MNFTIKQYNNRTYLTHSLPGKSSTDPLLMGMLQNNRIPGFADFTVREVSGATCLCYDIHELRSMKDIFARTVSRQLLLTTFDGILAALEAAQDYMIEESSVVLDPQYIFMDPTTFRIALICLPLMDYRNGNDVKSFFKSIMFNTIFDYNEPCDHVARIMNDLNGREFSSADFRELLKELGADRPSSEIPSSREADPFFDFDTLFQGEQVPQAEAVSSPEPSRKSAMETAEDLLSAALLQAVPTEDVTQPPIAEEPVVSASDPLSIADRLLSAALGGEVSPAEESPAPVKQAPVIPTPAEEGEQSARSRRSRARRENREPQPIAETPVIRETPKEAVPSHTDAFDFPVGLAPTGSAKKTDAMKAAEAILSALDLPVKEDANTPTFDPFADFATPKRDKGEQIEEDSFADFTTPIVSSRRKSGSSAPAKAPEPRKASHAPAKEQVAPADPFDFSASVKTSAPTDAMKAADELLSAALAGVSFDPPASAVKEATKKAPAPAAQFTPTKRTVSAGAAEGLDLFSTPPTKKTAAMLQAEAILDSLDLFAPSGDTAPSTPVEAPASRMTPPRSQAETSVSREPTRKGGFFSKLRKKEDDPTPVPQAPVQPVVPYFGSDGETTVLNVSQQMTMPAAPYLIRSSTGETVVLSKAVFRVGKDRDFVDYCISDNSAISRRHANFMVRNGDVFVIDTNSTNHTFVNGVMIRSNTEVKLTHGDEIRLANEDFMLYCAGTI